MKSYYIHLIRNGLTDENLKGAYIGHTDTELSIQGAQQIEQMKEEMSYPQTSVVFSSPLKRCTETARMIYPDKEPMIISDLIEYNFGEFEGKTADDLKEDELFSRWLAGEKGVEPPFGESNDAFARRICSCFVKITEGLMKTGTTRAAIFTHGGVIMSLLAAFGLPEAPMHEWVTPNACGYTIRVTPSIWMRGNKFEVIEEIPSMPYNVKDD